MDLPNRQSIRLKNFDYSSNGAYFVTICTQDREMLFGGVVNGQMVLNELGRILELVWESLSTRFPIIINTYQIMPNHFHAIIIIDNPVGASLVGARNNVGTRSNKRAGTSPAPTLKQPTLGNIIGAFKSLTTNTWGNGKFWQRNYFEHIIRNQIDFDKIAQYIINNPAQWDLDENNPNSW